MLCVEQASSSCRCILAIATPIEPSVMSVSVRVTYEFVLWGMVYKNWTIPNWVASFHNIPIAQFFFKSQQSHLPNELKFLPSLLDLSDDLHYSRNEDSELRLALLKSRTEFQSQYLLAKADWSSASLPRLWKWTHISVNQCFQLSCKQIGQQENTVINNTDVSVWYTWVHSSALPRPLWTWRTVIQLSNFLSFRFLIHKIGITIFCFVSYFA